MMPVKIKLFESLNQKKTNEIGGKTKVYLLNPFPILYKSLVKFQKKRKEKF